MSSSQGAELSSVSAPKLQDESFHRNILQKYMLYHVGLLIICKEYVRENLMVSCLGL